MDFLLSCDNLVDWSLWGHAIQAAFEVFLKHSSLFLLEVVQMFFKIVLLIYKLLNLLAMQINWLVIICGCNQKFIFEALQSTAKKIGFSLSDTRNLL